MSEPMRRDIQELRGVAILLVVLYHAGAILPSGFIGVDVFFVISGFVIAGSVRRSMRADDFSLSSFIGKRVRRILPALSVMLTIVVLASSWFSSVASRVQTVRTGLFASLGGANLFLYRFRPDGYFEVSEKTNALLHTWSLSLEEQFYLAFAIAIAVAFRIFNGRVSQSSAVRAIALVGFVSFVLCVVVAHFT
ncbi:MAG: acyltransferase family protein, partial [Ilumatobacteraceae bacterium]